MTLHSPRAWPFVAPYTPDTVRNAEIDGERPYLSSGLPHFLTEAHRTLRCELGLCPEGAQLQPKNGKVASVVLWVSED